MDEVREKEFSSKDKPIIGEKINASLCGELIGLEKNKAETFFIPDETMLCDDANIHAGFVFNAAAYAVLCAVNQKNSVIISSETKFLAPVELGHELTFKATVMQNEAKKREVKVSAFLLDIKVFTGIFYVAVFDKKLFKLRLKDEREPK